LLTIAFTVDVTSNPVPLVGDPKVNPTVPMASSARDFKQPALQAGAGADWKRLTSHPERLQMGKARAAHSVLIDMIVERDESARF
jgi:hypothetical protein